ncbi:alpha-E domain-containing protein [Microbulbifer hainanensis]|uniref:alpha-E domain-containing protein n=1 Tax=Microbulbifer hainanensis TaxID=2735675 RepID=UPI001D0052FF|nr:alpha-E domain-containing protein [Microbulbifer hainanensis]
MLSRVAERIYWSARYLERAENTARMINVYSKMLLDLPDGVDIGWYNLVALNSAQQLFERKFESRDEHSVIRFLIADRDYSGSVLSSLQMIRENIRTTRDALPSEAWEQVNESAIYATSHLEEGLCRSHRYDYLDGIVRCCQQLGGMLDTTMRRDAGWEFFRLGRNLERADMTTRILDAGASMLQGHPGREEPLNLVQIVCGNVLRSASAYQPYRRVIKGPVRSRQVVRFLLEDELFPRSVAHCIDQMIDAVGALPRQRRVLKMLKCERRHLFVALDEDNLDETLRDHLNTLQVQIAEFHEAFTHNWFSLERPEAQ